MLQAAKSQFDQTVNKTRGCILQEAVYRNENSCIRSYVPCGHPATDAAIRPVGSPDCRSWIDVQDSRPFHREPRTAKLGKSCCYYSPRLHPRPPPETSSCESGWARAIGRSSWGESQSRGSCQLELQPFSSTPPRHRPPFLTMSPEVFHHRTTPRVPTMGEATGLIRCNVPWRHMVVSVVKFWTEPHVRGHCVAWNVFFCSGRKGLDAM